MYLKYAHPGCSWWAKVAATGLSLLALGGICLRPSRHLQRGQQEATTELSAHVSLHCGERQMPPPGGQCVVKILHISDTHARHREMAQKFAMPPADLLLHTGDVTNLGTDPEFEDFDMWLDDLKHRYKHGIYVVTGNHDWMWALNSVLEKKLAPQELLNASFVQKKLSNARVLHHKLVEVAGLRIYGSDWCPWFEFTAPGDTWPADTARSRVYNHWKQELKGALAAPAHRYEEIPAGVDILMSHMAPRDIFDHIMEGTWGSSQALTQRIWAVKPKAHLFGHIHEGRGEWERCNASEAYRGGAEYAPVPGKVFAARPPPAASYPTDLILNNAQMNAQWVDEAYGGPNAAAIVAPGKLITAEWKQNRWQFTARPVAMAD